MVIKGRRHLVAAGLYVGAALGGFTVVSVVRPEGLFRDLGATETSAVVVGFAAAAVFLVGSVAATRVAVQGFQGTLAQHVGDARAASVRPFVSAAAYVLIVLMLLQIFGVEIRTLLLGGAVTGVAVGIAAQQTLGNFFAGMLLLIVHPFSVGERVVLRSGALGGEYEGIVTDMGLFYLTMQTERGSVMLPNVGVLSAAIGPGARASTPEERRPENEDKTNRPDSRN